MSYLEYRNFALYFSEEDRTLSLYRVTGGGQLACFLENAELLVKGMDKRFHSARDYSSCTVQSLPDLKFTRPENNQYWEYEVHLSGGPGGLPEVVLGAAMHGDRITLCALTGSVHLRGVFRNGRGAGRHVFLLNRASSTAALRNAVGPADNPGADMLYNRLTDSAVRFSGKTSVHFDWLQQEYVFSGRMQGSSRLEFRFEQQIGQTIFRTRYWSPISRKHQFKTPPVGWMTWYAVRFAASEQVVLDNAAKMKQLFADYNDKICIWVDWEWCHKALDGLGEPGVDVLHPRTDAYPRGLKYVSDEIKRLGMVPALWTGATCDGDWNEMLKKHPEYMLAKLVNWAGNLWVDLSHPEIEKEYIPRIFRQILEWGYEAIKWDCLLNSLRINDEYRAQRHQPDLSSEEAMHRLVKAARKVIGDKMYFLGCTACDRAALAANDIFDAFRIGGDVFGWKEFKENAVNRAFSYYPLHNTQNFLDPDTLVLREQYSTLEQARSRVTFFALTGMQLTVGDPVAELDSPRVDALRRAMPVAEIRPQEMLRKSVTGDTAVTVCTVARPFGSWYIAGVFNLGDEPRHVQVQLAETLNLPAGKYAGFDFWAQEFIGISETVIDLGLLQGGSCAALRLTKIEKVPVLIGSTRHLLQGAIELKKCEFNARKNCLSGKISLVQNDPVALYFYVPEKFSVVPAANLCSTGLITKLVLSGAESKTVSWQIHFRPRASR